MIPNFFENETAMVSATITAITGLLTGPVFQMDPAAVGSITAVVVVIFNLWVRAMVYSKQGAAKAASAAATEAVKAVNAEMAGPPGEVTAQGAQAIQDAVQDAVPGTKAPTVTPS